MHPHPTGRFDNSPRDYAHIVARPIAAAMGAEIEGVDLADVSDAQFGEIQNALFRHGMIAFRDQRITHADQAAFARRFGPFAEDAYTQGVAGHPDVQPVIREADARGGMIFGGGWHTDSPFLPQPPAISMLYGVEIPPWGGDTLFASSVLAYATLSPTMQQMLAPLRVRMSMSGVVEAAQVHQAPDASPLGRVAAAAQSGPLPPEIARKVDGAAHPLVRTHPATGVKALYCDAVYARGIDGLTTPEAEALLAFLVGHITQPAFSCRLRWAPGTFALWDNRLCVHQAFNDYEGHRREMYRCTIAGETPG